MENNMNIYPTEPTKFNETEFDPILAETDTFYCKSGFRDYPDHHCKTAYYLSKPFIKQFRTAIDIGCRDGEYTRYLIRDFKNIFAFDPRTRKFFPKNVDTTRVTHFGVPLGDSTEPAERIRNSDRLKGKGENRGWFYLDQFNIENVDYIKIDTDGYEKAIINGAMKTITKYWPVINLEVYFEKETLDFVINKLGYKVVAVCPRGYDHILIKEQ